MKNFKMIKTITLTTTAALLTSLVIGSPALAQGQTATVFKTYESCGSLKNDIYRLQCFDIIFSGGTYSREKIEKAKVAAFGNETAPKDAEAKNDLTVEVIRISKGSAGTHTFYLKNGQAWKQDDDRKLLTRSLPYKAEIKKSSFGSFNFSPVGSNRAIKVKRIR
jgi:peroxiredoxin family protein